MKFLNSKQTNLKDSHNYYINGTKKIYVNPKDSNIYNSEGHEKYATP